MVYCFNLPGYYIDNVNECEGKNMRQIKSTARFTKVLAQRFMTDHLMRMAASLSFSTLLTLVPFLILCGFVLSLFPFFHQAPLHVQRFILDNFVVSTATNVNAQVSRFVSQVSALKWPNIAALSVVSLMMVLNMVECYNDIWKVKTRYHFGWTLLLYWVCILLIPLALAIVLMVLPSLFSWSLLEKLQLYQIVGRVLLSSIPFLSSIIVFFLCNWVLPHARVKLKFAFVGAFFSAVLFSFAKMAFVGYVNFFTSYQLIYGALAAIPFFLIWVYLSWLIVLMGAQISHMLSTAAIKGAQPGQ